MRLRNATFCISASALIAAAILSGCSSSRTGGTSTGARTTGSASTSMGTISVIAPARAECALVLRSAAQETTRHSFKDGRLSVPAGKYTIVSYTVGVPAKDGNRWLAVCSQFGPEAVVAVDAGKTARLDIGTGLTAVAVVSGASAERANLDLRVEDSGGRRFTIQQMAAGARQPGFIAIDSSGKTVWQGSFQFG